MPRSPTILPALVGTFRIPSAFIGTCTLCMSVSCIVTAPTTCVDCPRRPIRYVRYKNRLEPVLPSPHRYVLCIFAKMDVDNHALIALVFERKPLWDKRHKFHTNRNVTAKYWREICSELKQDEYKVRKRWRYLRDQFAVELGKLETVLSEDETTTINPKWPYYKSLLFLKGQVKARKLTGRLKRPRSPSESLEDAEIVDSESVDNICTSPLAKNFEDSNLDDQPVPKLTSIAEMDVEHQILKYLKEKEKSRQSRTDTEHEHMLFFRSLLPHIDKIPQNKVLSFRNRIQSVVEEFAYES